MPDGKFVDFDQPLPEAEKDVKHGPEFCNKAPGTGKECSPEEDMPGTHTP